MLEYFREMNKSTCYGCRACEQICPTNAIEMKKDEEGFLYPELNSDKCINCSLCEKSCPFMNNGSSYENNFPLTYAVKNKNDKVLQCSSSGGAFSVLAEYVLKRNGVVVGCAYDVNWNPIHIIVDNIELLQSIRGSKYVQSDTLNTYSKVKDLLLKDKLVLYTGTPCQIAGLKQFLKKEYQTLITVDIVCHGVPSNQLFHKYLSFLENKYYGKLTDYKFRDKTKYGWISSGSYTIVRNKKIIKKNTFPTNDYYYYYYYLRGDIYRECCYSCKYANTIRKGDFTIADFWNVQNYHPDFFSKKGVSLFVLNNEKSKEIFAYIKSELDYVESNLEFAANENGNLKKPTSRPQERDHIYKRIAKDGFEVIAKKDCKLSHVIPAIKRIAPKSLKRKIKEFTQKKMEKFR